MNTVGLFAGRGDVVLFMLVMLFVGFYLGWLARKWYMAATSIVNLKFRKK